MFFPLILHLFSTYQNNQLDPRQVIYVNLCLMICGSIYAYAYVSAISVPSFHNAVCADFIPSVFQSFLPIMSSTHDQLLNLLLLQLPALLINLLANLLDPRQVRRCALNLTVLIVPFIFFYPLLIKSHS